MSSPWAVRIAEGFVVGISATMAWFIFTGMNEARLELESAREVLDVQLEVNQQLVDKHSELLADLETLQSSFDFMHSRLSALESGEVPLLSDLFKNVPTDDPEPAEVPRQPEAPKAESVREMSNTVSETPSEAPTEVFAPVRRSTDSTQELIDLQRALKR